MKLEQTVEYVLASTSILKAVEKGPPLPAVRKRVDLLAPREREVAALIAHGKTNREIAADLSIKEGTVEAHVQHILNKLGMNTRAQIAAWVVTHRTEPASPAH